VDTLTQTNRKNWTPLSADEIKGRLRDILPGTGDSRNDISISFSHLSMDGLEEMHVYSKDERLYEFFESPGHKTLEDTRIYLSGLLKRQSEEPGGKLSKYWFVRRTSDNQLLGSACLVNLDTGRFSVEWGYAIDPRFWGEGYVNQVCHALKHYVFEVLQLNRLWGQAMVKNERSVSSLRNVGMREEGIVKDFYYVKAKQQFEDAWLYRMTAAEYFADQEQARRQSARQGVTELKIEHVAQEVRNFLGDPDLDLDTKFSESLNWDSIAHVDLLVAVETRFEVKFSPKDVTRLHSIRNFYDVITNQESHSR